jgi:hypothetical protein
MQRRRAAEYDFLLLTVEGGTARRAHRLERRHQPFLEGEPTRDRSFKEHIAIYGVGAAFASTARSAVNGHRQRLSDHELHRAESL